MQNATTSPLVYYSLEKKRWLNTKGPSRTQQGSISILAQSRSARKIKSPSKSCYILALPFKLNLYLFRAEDAAANPLKISWISMNPLKIYEHGDFTGFSLEKLGVNFIQPTRLIRW